MGRPIAAGRRLASTSVSTRNGVRTVDLRDIGWVDPVHLVTVAAIAEGAHRAGLAFRLRGPDSADRSHYASRMRLGALVAELGGSHDLPDVVGTDPAGLVEVARLRTHDDVTALARLVHDQVAQLDRDLAHALHQGVAEMGQNVCDHARSVGFVAAQTIPRRGELRFAVADPGIGLLATLRSRGAGDDRTAIDLALDGVSESGRRGTGLPSTVRAITRLGGYLYLASGRASTRVTGARRRRSAGPVFDGTIVEGRVPTGRLVVADRGTMDSDDPRTEGGESNVHHR